MRRTRVKLCGITRAEDGVAAALAGVDAIGLVFYPPSARWVTTTQAAEILAVLPPLVTTVGLFVDADPQQVRAVLAALPLDVLQFHGSESATYCESFGRPYIKAVAMADTDDVLAYSRQHPAARALLLDSHGGGRVGGTGERFDWQRIPPQLDKPLILAGGLNPDNVAAAIRQVRPYAVDVSSGVEVTKGIKDNERVNAFMYSVTGLHNDATNA